MTPVHRQHHALSVPSKGLVTLFALYHLLCLTLNSTLKFLSLEVALVEATPLHALHVKASA